jgi:hypothetical protein
VLTLVADPHSSYTQKMKIALREKNVAFTAYIPPDLGSGRADVCETHYEAVNWGFGEIHRFNRATGTLADRLKAEMARQTVMVQAWLTERLGGSLRFGGNRCGCADG